MTDVVSGTETVAVSDLAEIDTVTVGLTVRVASDERDVVGVRIVVRLRLRESVRYVLERLTVPVTEALADSVAVSCPVDDNDEVRVSDVESDIDSVPVASDVPERVAVRPDSVSVATADSVMLDDDVGVGGGEIVAELEADSVAVSTAVRVGVATSVRVDVGFSVDVGSGVGVRTCVSVDVDDTDSPDDVAVSVSANERESLITVIVSEALSRSVAVSVADKTADIVEDSESEARSVDDCDGVGGPDQVCDMDGVIVSVSVIWALFVVGDETLCVYVSDLDAEVTSVSLWDVNVSV